MSRDLYNELIDHYATQPDRRGWVHVTCPSCGGDPDHTKPNFSFSKKGYNCYSCGYKGGLVALARVAGLWDAEPGHRSYLATQTPKTRQEPPEQPPPAWKSNPEAYVETYLHHPQRYKLWQTYKGVSRAIVDKYDFGVGVLPGQHETRLIVPLYWRGQVVGLKGRKLNDSQHPVPWIAAQGSNVTTLWGFNFVPPDADSLWICENYVDAALMSEQEQGFGGCYAVATGGARELTDEEIASVRRIKPKAVIMAYDNDLAGQATGLFREQLEVEWKEEQKRKHPDRKVGTPPHSRAFPAAAKLRQAGLTVILYPWQEFNAPHKADVYWALEQMQQPV